MRYCSTLIIKWAGVSAKSCISVLVLVFGFWSIPLQQYKIEKNYTSTKPVKLQIFARNCEYKTQIGIMNKWSVKLFSHFNFILLNDQGFQKNLYWIWIKKHKISHQSHTHTSIELALERSSGYRPCLKPKLPLFKNLKNFGTKSWQNVIFWGLEDSLPKPLP